MEVKMTQVEIQEKLINKISPIKGKNYQIIAVLHDFWESARHNTTAESFDELWQDYFLARSK